MRKKEEALEEFIKKVREKHGDKIDRIILYGSYARGEAEEESDIDVLIWRRIPGRARGHILSHPS